MKSPIPRLYHAASVRISFPIDTGVATEAIEVAVRDFALDDEENTKIIYFFLAPAYPNDKKLSRVTWNEEKEKWYYDYHSSGNLRYVEVVLLDAGMTAEELDRQEVDPYLS